VLDIWPEHQQQQTTTYQAALSQCRGHYWFCEILTERLIPELLLKWEYEEFLSERLLERPTSPDAKIAKAVAYWKTLDLK
ncbi:MAG: hypothetical protein WBD01_15465, partial [Salaquimonas sp.]